MAIPSTIGTRLEATGKRLCGSHRGWQSKFAELLEISSGSLRNYLSGRVMPGNVLQEKLRNLGADVEWIMTGNSGLHHEVDESLRVYFNAPKGVTEKQRKTYERLAALISKVPPEAADAIEAIVKVYLKGKARG